MAQMQKLKYVYYVHIECTKCGVKKHYDFTHLSNTESLARILNAALCNFIKAKFVTNVVTTKSVVSLEISVTVSLDDPLNSKIAR